MLFPQGGKNREYSSLVYPKDNDSKVCPQQKWYP